MNYLVKAYNHIKYGTLLSRLKDHPKIQLEKEWRSFYSDKKRNYIVKTLYKKAKMILYKDHLLSKSIFLDSFEAGELEFIKRHIKEGDVFLDVGANIGLFTLIASQLVGKKGLVLSFEPTERTFEKLLENIKINTKTNNIRAINVAISNHESMATIYLNDEYNDALNTMVRPTIIKKEQKIKCELLSKYVKTYSLANRRVFIKIDVEGHEIPVLEGLEKELKEGFAPDFLIEFNDNNYKNSDYSCSDIIILLKKYNYDFFEINSDFSTSPLEEKDFYTYTNILATR